MQCKTFKNRIRGRLPFDDDDIEIVYKNTLEGKFPITGSFWNNVSESAKDLLKSMLKVIP